MVEKSKVFSVTRPKIEVIAFFCMFFLYLWLVVDIRFVPSIGGAVTRFPVFYSGWDFFFNKCCFPGGLVEYLSSFLAQFFYFSWKGAIVVTIQAWLIYFFTRKFLVSLNMSRFSRLSFTGPVIMLALYNHYFYFFNIASGLLFALIFVYFYIALSEKKDCLPSLLIFLILSIFLYPIGGGTILMFALLCMIYELISRSQPVVGVTELSIAFLVAFVAGSLIYGMATYEAFTRLLVIDSKFKYIYIENAELTIIACILYLFLPVLSLFLWILQKIPRLPFSLSDKFRKFLSNVEDTQFVIVLILASMAVYFTYDNTRRNVYAADYYASNKNWDKALQTAENGLEFPFMLSIVNRALYHKGILPKYMFCYPQKISAPLYVTNAPEKFFKGLYQGTDFCIELGLMNHAEHRAWQKIEEFGPLPEFLKRLVIIKMVKGNIDAARVYLNTLSKTISHSDWAEEYLAKVDADPSLSSDEYISTLRENMIKTDLILGKGLGRNTLTKLLQDNKHNKMAFEYLMAIYLLNRQPEGVVQNLYRLPDFDYKETPKAYEEAYFLCLVYRRKVKYPKRFQISPESKKTFDALDQFMRKYGKDIYAIEKEVSTNFKNTYYEYCFYGYKNNLSPKGVNK